MKNKKVFLEEVNRCKVILDNISFLKIDTAYFKDRLKSIEEMANGEFISGDGFLQATKVDYGRALKEVMDLERKLMEYNTIYNINNSLSYLDVYLSENVNSFKVIQSADEIIESLKVYKSIKDKNEEALKIHQRLFKYVYKVIKLEFIYNDKSKVLDYIVNDKSYVSIINSMIISDIDNLISSVNVVMGLDDLKLELYKNKEIDMNYVNEDVFRLLVICLDSTILKDNLLLALEDFKFKVEDNINEVKKIDEKGLLNKTNIYKNSYYNKKFKARLFAYLLTCTLAINYGGRVLLDAVFSYDKLKAMEDYFTKTTSITESTEIKTEEDYMAKLEKEHQVLLEISDVIKGKKLYNYTYDVTDIVDESTLDSCPKIDVKELGLEPISSEVTDSFNEVSDEIREKYSPKYKYIIYEQDLTDGTPKFSDLMIILTVLVSELFILGSFKFSNFVFNNKNMRKESIQYLKYLINKLKEMKKVKVSRETARKLLKINDMFKEEYYKILKEKKELLTENPQVLEDLNGLMELNDILKKQLKLK